MRPVSVTIATVVHVVLLLLWVTAIFTCFHMMSPLGLAVMTIILALQLTGFVGIIRRCQWARLYNAVLFSFYGLFSSLGACGVGAREKNLLQLGWGLLLLVLFGSLVLCFLRGQRVRVFFQQAEPSATQGV